ncbi:MAG: ornithine carbamoyltransferase [Candidatus Omnitrophica bacterium]|nr:ornithine carbamoyltransferase [Candidatus Omnitrophota bacterium]
MKRDLISLKDLSYKDMEDIFLLTKEIKKNKHRFSSALRGKILGLIFEKPSCRTRVSFEVSMFELGGYSIYLGPQEINLGIRESIKDVAQTLSRYLHGIVIRTFAHGNVIEMAKYASIPVINGLSDFSHPCQVLSDLYTIKEKFKKLKGIKLTYVGDGNNNVCHSLLYACPKVGINLRIACPSKYAPDSNVVKEAERLADSQGSIIELFNCPFEAVKDADIIYTDVWTSMGKESERDIRRKIFRNFQVNKNLLSYNKKNCLIMHCLPAHRGEEITDEIIDSKNSIVFDQAENRLYIHKAILIRLLK